jgi:pimeloyl-ACP methyl ester carboxylesterase
MAVLDQIDVDGRRIAVKRRAGAGPGLFWLGGFRSDMEGSKALALDAHAAARGLACTRFDYSGHGASGGDFADGTISRWCEEAGAVLATTAGPQILVGSSMGGWIALLLARALAGSGRISGLVLVAPAPDFTERLMWPQLAPAIRARLMETGRYEQPSAYSATPTLITRALIEDGRRNLVLDTALAPGAPVHILQGIADPDVPWRHALALLDRLTGVDATLELVRDGDHRLSRPEDLARLIAAVDAMADQARASQPR